MILGSMSIEGLPWYDSGSMSIRGLQWYDVGLYVYKEATMV